MFAHKEISRKVCGPTCSESAPHRWCGSTANAVWIFGVLSVLYTVFVLIFHRINFSLSTITPCKLWLNEKKNNEPEISTWVFPLESLSNKIYNLVHKGKCYYPNDQYLNEIIAYTTTLCIWINWNRQLQFCLYSRWNSAGCGFLLRTFSCIGQCLEHHGCTCWKFKMATTKHNIPSW